MARLELKYLLSPGQARIARFLWDRHLLPDPNGVEHGSYPVLSQYYDSPDLQFHLEKGHGNPVRSKLRLRVYGQSFKNAPSFLEIKRRENDSVEKLRFRLNHVVNPVDFNFEKWERSCGEIPPAFHFIKERYGLVPSARVFYMRRAFLAPAVPGLRITFDTSVIGLLPGEALSPSIFYDTKRYLVPECFTILEVKVTDAPPSWFHNVAAKIRIERRPIPKYVLAVDRLGQSLLHIGDFQC